MPSLDKFNTDLLAEASSYAIAAHAGQVRKGTTIPYAAHLLAVCALVLEHGGDSEQAAAALLHDVVEDCGAGHRQAIAERFGPRVAMIVEACTDADVLPKPPWRARKEAYLAHLAEAPSDALLVSLADKVHNARAIVGDLRAEGMSVFDRFRGGVDGTVWYYTALAEAFSRLLPGRLSETLASEVRLMASIVRDTRSVTVA
ncbi:HD domain-containing protein [Muricoccus radiodurans]|uniref:HD domain-containing protein n=1 Tax=Muricoccus radiodurans TaxID=2231721 RepID=UPI003CEBBAB1